MHVCACVHLCHVGVSIVTDYVRCMDVYIYIYPRHHSTVHLVPVWTNMSASIQTFQNRNTGYQKEEETIIKKWHCWSTCSPAWQALLSERKNEHSTNICPSKIKNWSISTCRHRLSITTSLITWQPKSHCTHIPRSTRKATPIERTTRNGRRASSGWHELLLLQCTLCVHVRKIIATSSW